MKSEYEAGRREALQKCLEAVWDICGPNGQGAYSEGQYDACDEVAKAIIALQSRDEAASNEQPVHA